MTSLSTSARHERLLSELDHVRLQRLGAASWPEALQDVMEAPELVAPREVPPDVVTMYSMVTLTALDGSDERQLTLTYPQDAEPARGFVSVLSPVGAGLLGLRVGDVARWRTPDGREHAARVAALLFQPEASGDYTT